MVQHDDPRKAAFLSQIPTEWRSDATYLFLRQIRAGMTDPKQIANKVYRDAAERFKRAESGAYERGEWSIGDGTVPADTMRAAIVSDKDRTLDYVRFLLEWEAMTPAEKEQAKASTKAQYRARWWRAQDGGAR